MKSSDQLILESRYELINEIRILEEELDTELNGCLEEGLFDKISSAKQAITNLPQFINLDLPQYIEKMKQWIGNAGLTFFASVAGSIVLGKILVYSAKKITQTAANNSSLLQSLLPMKIQKMMKPYLSLEQTDETAFYRKSKEVHDAAMKEIREGLERSGMKTEAGVLAKTLTVVGNILSSGYGSFISAVFLTWLLHHFGFNIMPVFPTLMDK